MTQRESDTERFQSREICRDAPEERYPCRNRVQVEGEDRDRSTAHHGQHAHKVGVRAIECEVLDGSSGKQRRCSVGRTAEG